MAISAKEFFGGKVPPPPAETVIDTSSGPKKRTVGADVAIGFGKELADTFQTAGAQNAGPVGQEMLRNAPAFARNVGALKDVLPASNTAQKAGKVLGFAAELATPTGGPRAASAAVRAVPKAAKAPLRLAGKVAETTGQKIQQSVIRPSIYDIKDGFKVENIAKYDVGGTLPETIAKSHTKMNELTQELAAKLKESDVKINLEDTLRKTAERLGADKNANFGDNAALDRVLNQIGDEVARVGSNEVDLVAATNVKRGAGSKGAWAYNRPEADASAIERAYTEFYNVLKEEIEKAAPAGVKEINKQLSELIPIQTAALRRLPVEQRNNVFSLTDSIGFFSALFDPRALLLVGATKAAKSGRVGNALVNAGRKLQGK